MLSIVVDSTLAVPLFQPKRPRVSANGEIAEMPTWGGFFKHPVSPCLIYVEENPHPP